MFIPPLQGDIGLPGETGDPGPEGEKVSILLYFAETGEWTSSMGRRMNVLL